MKCVYLINLYNLFDNLSVVCRFTGLGYIVIPLDVNGAVLSFLIRK